MIIQTQTSLEVKTCSECGTVYGIQPELIQQRVEDHKTFYCPNGHTRYFPQESVEEKLRRQLTEAMDREANLFDEMIRLKSRIKRGVCPCCKRTFTNIQRHMAAKHPRYK